MDAKVRPARAADKAQLLSFIKEVWGGHDYIPRVWDEWLKDRTGSMFVVEVDGLPVGMNRVRFLEDGSAWLEGARIHPRFRGMGLASMLGENSMRLASERGANVIRLTSWSRNKAAHRQIARMNFREVSRISAYEPGKSARFEPQKGVVRVGMEDFTRIKAMIVGSREYKLGAGVYWDAFKATSLSPAIIEMLVREGSVWTIGESVVVARAGGEGDEKWKQVCFLTGKDAEPLKLMRHVFGLKSEERTSRRIAYIPQGSSLIGVLRDNGFSRLTSVVLFERAPAKG